MTPEDFTAAFPCCPRASGKTFRYHCNCPAATLVYKLRSGTASMFGFNEFGTQSNPPKFYQQYSCSGGGWAWDQYDLHASLAHYSSKTFAGFGLSAWAFNPSTGSTPASPTTETDCTVTLVIEPPYSGSGSPSTTVSNKLVAVENVVGADGVLLQTSSLPRLPSGSGIGTVDPNRPPDVFTGQSFFPMDFSVTSPTSASFSMTGGEFDDTDAGLQNIVGGGTITFELSGETTEAQALAVALAGLPDISASFGPAYGAFDDDQLAAVLAADVWSLSETRLWRDFDFSQGTFKLNLENLKPVLGPHRWTVKFRKRTAARVYTTPADPASDGYGETTEYGDWEDADDLEMSDVFNPTSPDGTWSSDDLDFPVVEGCQVMPRGIWVEVLSTI